jgi:hypothetical protein
MTVVEMIDGIVVAVGMTVADTFVIGVPTPDILE